MYYNKNIYIIARALISLKKYDEALHCFDNLLIIEPNNNFALYEKCI